MLRVPANDTSLASLSVPNETELSFNAHIPPADTPAGLLQPLLSHSALQTCGMEPTGDGIWDHNRLSRLELWSFEDWQSRGDAAQGEIDWLDKVSASAVFHFHAGLDD